MAFFLMKNILKSGKIHLFIANFIPIAGNFNKNQTGNNEDFKV